MQGSLSIWFSPQSSLKSFFREVFDSSLKTTIFLILAAVVFSGFLFSVFLIKQNIETNKEIDFRKQVQRIAVQETVEKTKAETIAENNWLNQTRKQDLSQIQSVLKKFKTKTGFYPANLINLVPNYLKIVPKDPKTKKEYFYQAGVDQKSYQLRAILSNGEEYSLEEN